MMAPNLASNSDVIFNKMIQALKDDPKVYAMFNKDAMIPGYNKANFQLGHVECVIECKAAGILPY